MSSSYRSGARDQKRPHVALKAPPPAIAAAMRSLLDGSASQQADRSHNDKFEADLLAVFRCLLNPDYIIAHARFESTGNTTSSNRETITAIAMLTPPSN